MTCFFVHFKLNVKQWSGAGKISWGKNKILNIKHSCGLLNVVFTVYVGLIQSSHYFIKGEGG